MKIKVGITTCVYPCGLKRLLDSMWVWPDADMLSVLDIEVAVFMDGNRDYLPLWRMDEHAATFAGHDRYVNLTDVKRLTEDNLDVQDYEFLREYEARGLQVFRHPSNLGAVANFNAVMEWGKDADVAVLLMDDEVVRGHWIGGLAKTMMEFPNVVMAGWSNLSSIERGAHFRHIQAFDELMSCTAFRGVYLRELINVRGWVFCPQFNFLCADAYLIQEVNGRGHDIGFVTLDQHEQPAWSPGHHKSLGNWQFEKCMADKKAMADGAYPQLPCPTGRHTYVLLDPETLDVKEWRHGPS